jgi:hypothetical protein
MCIGMVGIGAMDMPALWGVNAKGRKDHKLLAAQFCPKRIK